MRKCALILFAALLLLAGCSNDSSGLVEGGQQLQSKYEFDQAEWNEVEYQYPEGYIPASIEPFDLKKKMEEGDYIFRGKVTAYKEYELTLKHADGSVLGPYLNSLFEVEVLENIGGKPPKEAEKLVVYCPFTNSKLMADAYPVIEGNEYIFFGQLYDDEWDKKMEGNPYKQAKIEEISDVAIGNNFYSLLPIENGLVVAPSEYKAAAETESIKDINTLKQKMPKTTVAVEAIGDTISVYAQADIINAIRGYKTKYDNERDIK